MKQSTVFLISFLKKMTNVFFLNDSNIHAVHKEINLPDYIKIYAVCLGMGRNGRMEIRQEGDTSYRLLI